MNRGKLDDTLAAMFSNLTYAGDYLFYAHMIGQCSIKINHNLPAPAGVSFMRDHYNMYINPDGINVTLEQAVQTVEKINDDLIFEENGEKMYRLYKGFDHYTLEGRLAILKHEVLHIMLDHLGRFTGLDHKIANISADCAENQLINPNHLPKDAILPSTLAEQLEVKVPTNQTAEFYYELIKSAMKNKPNSKGASGESCDKIIEELLEKLLDSHDTWGESEGDPDLKKDLTKKMIEKSQLETIKSKGTVPSNISDIIALHNTKSKINWKNVLRRIVGNKRVGKRATIMRKNRRFPGRDDLRGVTKERSFNVLIIADVSGSMSQKAVVETVQEVKHICDITKSNIDLIQIDTIAHEPEKITKNTTFFNRKASGGTSLFPAIEKAQEYNIDYQAVIILTDGELYSNELEDFNTLNKKIIWLIEPSGKIMDGMNSGKMKAFKLD